MLAGASATRYLASFGAKARVSPSCSLPRTTTSLKRQSKMWKRLFSSDQVDDRLKALGLEWPGPVRPINKYVGAVRSGSLVFLSGHLPYNPPHKQDAQNLIKGKVGKDITVEAAQIAARNCALGLLGTLRDNTNNWEHVRRIVKVTGYVNSVEGFEHSGTVLNGASDLIVQLLGEHRGLHTRTAIGVTALPLNVAVEVEMIAELDDQFA